MHKSSWLNWFIFLLLSFVWGSSFILMKEGLKALNAWQVASLRILSAGMVLLPFAVKAWKAVPRSKVPVVLLSGFLGTFFPAYLFCIAETRLDSALAGILNALTPLFTLLVGVWVFKNRITASKWAGVWIGLAGLVLLILLGQGKVDFAHAGYAGFILLATACYGFNVNMVNQHLKNIGSMDIAALAFTALILPAALTLWATGFELRPTADTGFYMAVGASVLLGVAGTAISSVLFYVLLKNAGPVLASMVTYGIPFVALFWGWLAGETINIWQIACLGMILAGVYLARK
jgi:drug/metabolite transporter (DMT)-like permease